MGEFIGAEAGASPECDEAMRKASRWVGRWEVFASGWAGARERAPTRSVDAMAAPFETASVTERATAVWALAHHRRAFRGCGTSYTALADGWVRVLRCVCCRTRRSDRGDDAAVGRWRGKRSDTQGVARALLGWLIDVAPGVFGGTLANLGRLLALAQLDRFRRHHGGARDHRQRLRVFIGPPLLRQRQQHAHRAGVVDESVGAQRGRLVRDDRLLERGHLGGLGGRRRAVGQRVGVLGGRDCGGDARYGVDGRVVVSEGEVGGVGGGVIDAENLVERIQELGVGLHCAHRLQGDVAFVQRGRGPDEAVAAARRRHRLDGDAVEGLRLGKGVGDQVALEMWRVDVRKREKQVVVFGRRHRPLMRIAERGHQRCVTVGAKLVLALHRVLQRRSAGAHGHHGMRRSRRHDRRATRSRRRLDAASAKQKSGLRRLAYGRGAVASYASHTYRRRSPGGSDGR